MFRHNKEIKRVRCVSKDRTLGYDELEQLHRTSPKRKVQSSRSPYAPSNTYTIVMLGCVCVRSAADSAATLREIIGNRTSPPYAVRSVESSSKNNTCMSSIISSHRQKSIARSPSGRMIALPARGILPLSLADGNCVRTRDQAAPHRRGLAAIESILESLTGLRDTQQRVSRGAARSSSHCRGVSTRVLTRYKAQGRRAG